jgi:hypothetical protein
LLRFLPACLLPGPLFDGSVLVLQQSVASQALRNQAAAAAGPAMLEPRRKARGFSPFQQSNATRMGRAALRFEPGYSL